MTIVRKIFSTMSRTQDFKKLTEEREKSSFMENLCDVPMHLLGHDYCRETGDPARPARRHKASAKCCTNNQGPKSNRKQQRSATPGSVPQKRKWISEAPPSTPGTEHPEVLNGVPTPPPSPPVDFPGVLNLVPRSQSTISPDELPVVSRVAPSPQLSTAPLQDDSPLRIHNRSVEEFQQIYHEVVGEMLRFKNGGARPYSLKLGRQIKQKLWARLNRPTVTTSEDQDGLLHVDMSYGVGVCPLHYDVDVSGEPEATKREEQNKYHQY